MNYEDNELNEEDLDEEDLDDDTPYAEYTIDGWLLDSDPIELSSGMPQCSENEYYLVGCIKPVGEQKELSIPSAIDGKKIIGIADNAFSKQNGAIYQKSTIVSKVEIAEGIKYIGPQAFCCCSALEHVELPSTIERIGNACFSGCDELQEIVLPEKLERLEGYTFNACRKLNKVVFPKNIRKISMFDFYCCGFTSISLPEGLEELGGNSFGMNQQLEVAYLPKSLNVLQESAFNGCPGRIVFKCYPGSVGFNYARNNGLKYQLI